MKKDNIGFVFSAVPVVGLWFTAPTDVALSGTLFYVAGCVVGYFWKK